MLNYILLQRTDLYYFTFTDIIYSAFLIFIIYYFAKSIRDKRIEKQPEYKFFLPALLFKVLGGIGVVLVYNAYYYGGDINYYFFDSRTLVRLLYKNFVWFGDIVFNGVTIPKLAYLDSGTGFFVYYRNAQTFFVARVLWPFTLVGLQAMIPTAILFSVISFGGVWRMYKVFIAEFPSLYKQFAWAFFFIPSVFFWGSGLLKDAITFSAIGYFFHSFYYAIINPRKRWQNIIIVAISLFIIISIKPYIFVGVLPGALIWTIRSYTSRIQGSFIRGVSYPLILAVGAISGYFLLVVLSAELGKYSLDKILDEAVTSNKDFKNTAYKGNSFDIGEIKPTFESMISKAPLAVNASLFRPYITEAANILMMVSGLENLFILGFTIYILWRVRVVRIIGYFNKHHLLTFSLIFSLFFAFSVGISTANFGSLVRYRIPLLPFYLSALIIIRHFEEEKSAEAKARKYTYYEAYG